MKNLTLTFFMMFFTIFGSFAQAEFELEPNQSMSITGKGPGQDATVNPYFGQDCYALVENIGKKMFSVRIQKQGVVLREIMMEPGKFRKIELLSDQELYFDPNDQGKTKATIQFEKPEK